MDADPHAASARASLASTYSRADAHASFGTAPVTTRHPCSCSNAHASSSSRSAAATRTRRGGAIARSGGARIYRGEKEKNASSKTPPSLPFRFHRIEPLGVGLANIRECLSDFLVAAETRAGYRGSLPRVLGTVCRAPRPRARPYGTMPKEPYTLTPTGDAGASRAHSVSCRDSRSEIPSFRYRWRTTDEST